MNRHPAGSAGLGQENFCLLSVLLGHSMWERTPLWRTQQHTSDRTLAQLWGYEIILP